MVRKVFWLNFFDSFIGGAIILAVPLLMLQLEIDVKEIGLVFAVAPLASFGARIISSVIADRIGEKVFYILNALCNAAQSLLYLFVPSTFGFAAGKMFDGARSAFIWAVNRTSIISASHNKHFTLGSLVGGRQVYFALGCLSVALLAPQFGFGFVFALCLAISLVMLYLSLDAPNSARENVSWNDLLAHKRDRLFYETAIVMAIGSTFYMIMLYILLPIFFSKLGFSPFEIGILYAIYALLFGIVLQYISHHGWESKKVAIIGAAGFAVTIFGMALYPAFAPLLFVLMAIGDANLALVWEETIYLQARHSKKKSTDIALLHAPGMLLVFLASAASGFAIEMAGFAAILVVTALSLVLYAFLSLRLIDKQVGASALQTQITKS
ncbi:MAG: MFS transporter [Candidatus Micrarchaeota archaeon]|nr:MFS transporter [Candidatus Micrarchaeota archaeon]